MNLFKDKIVLARPAALQDLERIASHDEFDTARIAQQLHAARCETIGWSVCDFAARETVRWSDVRRRLRPRMVYARAMQSSDRDLGGLPADLLARRR